MQRQTLLVAGLGDMAVSNTIGSNVFDILVGLGVPWALQTMCVDYGSVVRDSILPALVALLGELVSVDPRTLVLGLLQVVINSRGLLYSVVLLLGSVALTVSTAFLQLT